MNKFKVGDRVKICNANQHHKERYNGDICTIEKINPNGLLHGGKTHYGLGNGYVWFEDEIELTVDRYELRITCNDGKTTNAVYKVNGKIEKRTEAVCAPSDTFSFNAGAELAINRVLYGTDYNPKDVAFKPTQPIAPQEGKPKFSIGQRVIVTDNTGHFVKQIATILDIDKSDPRTPFKVMFDKGKLIMWCHSEDIEPYAEPEQPKQRNDTFDSLIYGYQASSLFRAELFNRIKFPAPAEPSLAVTREMLVKLGACSGGLAEFDKKFPSGKGEFEEVRKATDVSNSCWLHNHRFSISTMQNEQPKEAVKLYCVKDDNPWLTKGETYSIEASGRLVLDNGLYGAYHKTFEELVRRNPSWKSCLVPLIKRPAKVGEWVLPNDDGKICEVKFVGSNGEVDVKGGHKSMWLREYEVLDGYTPEPEKEPEPAGWNGKVVCVDHGGYSDLYTAGKIYTFTDGQMTNDDGCRSNSSYKCKSFEELEANFSAKFIPYLGEA